MIEKVTSIREIAILKLTPFFWGKPRMASILTALVEEVQELEDALFEVLDARNVDNADLVRLKVLGKLVGQDDFDFTEEEYSKAIKAKIAANRSNGHWADIKAVLEILAGAGKVDLHLGVLGTVWAKSDSINYKSLSAVMTGTAVESGHSLQVHSISSGTGTLWGDHLDPLIGTPLDTTNAYYTTEVG